MEFKGFVSFSSINRYELLHEIFNSVVCDASKGLDQSVHTYHSISVKLLTEHHLEFLSLKGGCTGSSESTHVKMPHCWKSHVPAYMLKFRWMHHVVSLLSSTSFLITGSTLEKCKHV